MGYKYTKHNGKKIYVPIVVKNKECLVYYIKGTINTLDMVQATMSVLTDMDVDFHDVCDAENLGISSQQFNDILDIDVSESKMTDGALKRYYEKKLASDIDKYDHSDNLVSGDAVLSVSCPGCGFGHYSWKDFESIPQDNFNCVECGRPLIEYIGD